MLSPHRGRPHLLHRKAVHTTVGLVALSMLVCPVFQLVPWLEVRKISFIYVDLSN